jgi:hypothetical protein
MFGSIYLNFVYCNVYLKNNKNSTNLILIESGRHHEQQKKAFKPVGQAT